MKVIDKIREREARGEKFFSFEFFPPKTDEGLENLWERMDLMVAQQPLFCDITWGAGGSTADLTLDIASKMQNEMCVDTMMHLTCTNMPKEKLKEALERVKADGLQNILALRGDPPKGATSFQAVEGGFSCALDLVKYIREEYGDFFGITVAGYPEAHPEVIKEDPEEQKKAYASDLAYLKKKVDAGADVIVTQLFYDVDIFLKFINDCRQIGITVPILPGIMPVQTYGGFKRMTEFCKTYVPPEITAALEPIKDNDEAVRNYGVELGAQMCRRILASGVQGLHMYSLNQEKAVFAILERVGMINFTHVPRAMPWRQPTTMKNERRKEGVRPVYWLARQRNYLARTAAWADYPQGRWGHRKQDIAKLPHYLAARPTTAKGIQARAAVLAAAPIASGKDAAACFKAFFGGKANAFPWQEGHKPTAESAAVSDKIIALIDKGLLVTSAGGRLNGEPSTGPQGWGHGGHVYQKAFVEFFAPPEAASALKAKLSAAPGVAFACADAKGSVEGTLQGPTAVSWGVFPGKELCQPVVADRAAFAAWADEAFSLWTDDWAALYPEGDASRAALDAIKGSYTLFSVVAEDYVNGDVFGLLLG